MKPQDHYLNLLLRVDWLTAMVRALQAFYAAPSEALTRLALDKLREIQQRQP